MPTSQPVPQDVSSLLWVALLVIVPSLLAAIGILWRQGQQLRDSHDAEQKQALEKERAANDAFTKALEAHTDVLEKHTAAVQQFTAAQLAVEASLKAVQASLVALEKRVNRRGA